MSHITVITCDRCGVTKPQKPAALWWDLMYTSMDQANPDGNFDFLSGSWDLCGDCAAIVRDAVVAVAGPPRDGADPIPDPA